MTFVALEYEVRSHIHAGQELGVVRSELQQSEDVLFHWSLIAATWDDEVAAKLMTMIVELWVTVRGFSLASAWIEQYKGAIRKRLYKKLNLFENRSDSVKFFVLMCFVLICFDIMICLNA